MVDTTAIKEWQDANPLRVWRKENGLSMRGAAPLIGTSMNSIQDWEQGQYVPNDDSFEKLNQHIPGIKGRWMNWYELRPRP